jgi:hypothetical protein
VDRDALGLVAADEAAVGVVAAGAVLALPLEEGGGEKRSRYWKSELLPLLSRVTRRKTWPGRTTKPAFQTATEKGRPNRVGICSRGYRRQSWKPWSARFAGRSCQPVVALF